MTDSAEDTSPDNRAFQSRPWLVRLGQDYKRGIEEAGEVVLLPEVAIAIGVDREQAAAAGAIAGLLGSTSATSGIHNLLKDKPEVRAEKERIAKSRLAELDQIPHVHSLLLWLRQAALVRAWASLEAFMEDVWTETLNLAGQEIRQGAFSSVAGSKDLNGSSNLSDMQVKVGFLARYDFNLQNKIGTVLAEKCSFKTVDGIGRAYATAFGWKQGHAAPAFPDPKALRKVELKRHAIVHRGGTIDIEYARKAGIDAALIGKPLELTIEAVVDDINIVLAQGGQLLRQLLLWLEAVEPVVASPPGQTQSAAGPE